MAEAAKLEQAGNLNGALIQLKMQLRPIATTRTSACTWASST